MNFITFVYSAANNSLNVDQMCEFFNVLWTLYLSHNTFSYQVFKIYKI
jgi:hypothetical protein